MATRTLEDLRDEIMDILSTEHVDPPPGAERILRALNRAKNDVVAKLDRTAPQTFTYRRDYAVHAGDAALTLPDGSDPEYPRFRRLLGLSQVWPAAEEPVRVYDRRDPAVREAPSGWWLYLEAGKLYFSPATGAPAEMTLRLRYAALVPDLDWQQGAAAFALLSEEWTDLLVLQAALDLLPAGNPGRAKWQQRRDERLVELIQSAARPIDDRPLAIREVDW